MSEHYFSPTPEAPWRRRETTARVWGHNFAFTTAAGVFAAGGLDKATAILLDTPPPPREISRALDLGCGWGAIAVALAGVCPQAQVDAVDVNERALALCAENAERAGVGDRVSTLLPAQADPQACYDEIWSNPPIRIGKQALHELLGTWLARLAPTGTAHLVVGKNLGADSLHRWLSEQGWACERTAAAKGFRVLTVRHREH